MKIKQTKISGAGVYLGALATITIVAGSALVIPNVAADNSSADQVQINVQSSCTLSGTNGYYDVEIVNGTKNENIGNSVISAFCNDGNGFGIYAVGASNDDEGDTYMHHDSDSTYDFNTGTTFSGDTSAWAMKITPTTNKYTPQISTGFDSFHVIPNQYTMVAYRDDTQGGSDDIDTPSAVGSEITATYGIYVSSYQAPGTYTGKVRYALVHPYSNTNLVSLQKALSDANAPTKTVGGKTYFTMQGMTSNICATANIIGEGSQLKMVDNRDDKIYWVTKLADGHCWMTQNLDHDIVTTAGYYTPENTDITAAWTPERATIASSSIDSTGKFTGYTNDNTNPYSADPGDWYFTDTYYNNACNSDPWCRYTNPSADATTLEKFSRTPFLKNGEHGHVGNFYNWTAAIASNDSSAYASSTMANVANSPQTSICPAGWRLPTISSVGANDEFTNLLTLYGAYPVADNTQADKALLASPLYFVRAGIVDDGVLYSGGRDGFYWSSTVESGALARGLYYVYAGISPQLNYGRLYGFSLRCLAR